MIEGYSRRISSNLIGSITHKLYYPTGDTTFKRCSNQICRYLSNLVSNLGKHTSSRQRNKYKALDYSLEPYKI